MVVRVMHAVDTSVLVRRPVQDGPEGGSAAARLLDGETGISLAALAETAFVLSRFYGVPRKRSVGVPGADKTLAASALLLCRPSGRVSYVNALLDADARAHDVETLYAFDERFPSEGPRLKTPG